MKAANPVRRQSKEQSSKLYRNLKPGDVIRIETVSLPYRSALLTVTHTQECERAFFTGKRQWAIHGNYPWWFPGPIRAYADERVNVVPQGAYRANHVDPTTSEVQVPAYAGHAHICHGICTNILCTECEDTFDDAE